MTHRSPKVPWLPHADVGPSAQLLTHLHNTVIDSLNECPTWRALEISWLIYFSVESPKSTRGARDGAHMQSHVGDRLPLLQVHLAGLPVTSASTLFLFKPWQGLGVVFLQPCWRGHSQSPVSCDCAILPLAIFKYSVPGEQRLLPQLLNHDMSVNHFELFTSQGSVREWSQEP